uniref:Uncharacterized protein n=1 Tax=Micrurus paraensis TaxID=1970185 RepID=A0A2D4KF26_9SAUR
MAQKQKVTWDQFPYLRTSWRISTIVSSKLSVIGDFPRQLPTSKVKWKGKPDLLNHCTALLSNRWQGGKVIKSIAIYLTASLLSDRHFAPNCRKPRTICLRLEKLLRNLLKQGSPNLAT